MSLGKCLSEYSGPLVCSLTNTANFTLCSAFNPPVAGSEDHNDDGVYPVVDDDGNKIYDYSPEDLPKLVKPPRIMAQKKK